MNTLSLSKNLVCQYQLRNSYLSLPCALPSLSPIPSSLGHFTATIYLIRPSRGTLSSTRSSHPLPQRNLQQFAASASMDSIALSEQSGSDVNETLQKTDTIVQYIVLRKDLVETMKWPLGSVVSQGCHAAVAAIWLHKDDSVTAQYCGPENLDFMHKVTLEVKGETQLRNLAQKLENAGVAHKLWMEQPENVPTCLATKPYRKKSKEEARKLECLTFYLAQHFLGALSLQNEIKNIAHTAEETCEGRNFLISGDDYLLQKPLSC